MSVTLKSPSGVSLPLGTRIYELPLLYSGTSFTELTRVPTSLRLRHEIVARMWQFPHVRPSLAHPCPPELDLMNMVIMGNHSINAARSNFLWFSPRYPPPSDSISTDSTTMIYGFFSHTHKNSSPTLLVCEGDLYGASCPPLLGSEQQRRGDNLYPLPIRGAPQQGPLAPLAQQGGS